MKKISGPSVIMGKLKLLGIRMYWGKCYQDVTNCSINQPGPLFQASLNNDQFWKVKPAIETITALISK